MASTPLRYPGGKQKLAPFVLEVLEANDLVGGAYSEPYAGGGGVGFELLLSDKISHFYLNDSCVAIHSIWASILHNTDEFCRRIRDTPLNIEIWKQQREIVSRSAEFPSIDVGFAAFYLNRSNRSGIIAGGGVIGGLKQDGEWKMDARFPKEKLIARILAIAQKRDSITVSNLDAEVFIRDAVPTLPERTLIYFDPPYFNKASGLYFNAYKREDHGRIATAIQNLTGRWMVSYDNTPQIRRLYAGRRQFAFSLQYNAASAYKGKEVFFFSDAVTVPKSSGLKMINKALWRVQR